LPLRAAFDAAAAEELSSRCPLAAACARACWRCWLFQWFFTALSSRPGSSFAIAGHVGRGTVASAFFSTASSHSLHDPRFTGRRTRRTATASAGSVRNAATRAA
jgi:hypothetical protein